MDIHTDTTARARHFTDVQTHDWPEEALVDFMAVRGRLTGIASRMLGSKTEAEDVVQDVWLRWQMADRQAVRNPRAFLVTATTRLAINVLQSARMRREAGATDTSPEPAARDLAPGEQTERDDAIDQAVLLLIGTLSPVERAAYILREAFSYPYREIARILRVQEANARQLVTRARARVLRQPRVAVVPADRRRLREAFLAASRGGDMTSLERLLTVGSRAS